MRFENNENKPTNTKGMWKIEGIYYNKGFFFENIN